MRGPRRKRQDGLGAKQSVEAHGVSCSWAARARIKDDAAHFGGFPVSSIAQALQNISTHRDVVPAYFIRSTGQWVITGVGRTHGGAVLLDDGGQIAGAFSSKRDALASIGSN